MDIKRLHSRSNPIIKDLLAIKRGKGGGFFIEGAALLKTALESRRIKPKTILFTGTFRDKNARFFEILSIGRDVLLIETTEGIINALCDTVSPQGIAALATYDVVPLEGLSFKGAPLLVLCDRIRDPGNLGTLIRSAAAFGADAVITLPETCESLSAKAIRASAGAVFQIPVLSCAYREILDYLRSRGISLICADVSGDKPLSDCDLTKAVAIAFGNETQGPTSIISGASDYKVSIGMQGSIDSLNVAIAGSIFLYEAMAQRGRTK